MKNGLLSKTLIIIISITIIGLILFFPKHSSPKQNISNQPALSQPPVADNATKPIINSSQLTLPLDAALERATKKPFGIYITPKNSPVNPEKFTGYHTGVDFEIKPGEENKDITVSAVCAGRLLLKKYASGYGGVAIESCELDNQAVTIIYGHLKLSSINPKAGQEIAAGQTLGILGKGYSNETDGERKHLHLGIHKGAAMNLLGYVQDKKLLDGWLNALDYLK